VRPTDLQQIRDLADEYAKQDKMAKLSKGEAQMRQIAKGMQEQLPGEMRAQDRNFSKAMGRIENTKRSLGLGSKVLRENDPELAIKAGNMIARAGESSKAGASADRRLRYFQENGPPAVMRSARGQAPDLVDYTARADVPRLQLAQEKLQGVSSPVFSGAGMPAGAGSVWSRAGQLGVSRLVYPGAKIAADAHLGPQSLVGDRLINVLRSRWLEDK
jgi:hypothetical protein